MDNSLLNRIEAIREGRDVDIEEFLRDLSKEPPESPAAKRNRDLCSYPGDAYYKYLTNRIIELGKKALALLSLRTPWWPIDDATIPKCNSVADVVAQVKIARDNNKTLRACGAQHSVPGAIFEDKSLKIKLEGDLRQIKQLQVAPDKSWAIYSLGGGCNLGIDVHDPTSTKDNSITHRVDADGFAINILGGMSHQTVAGFMSTASAGGTFKYCFHDCLQSIQFVDGTGELIELRRNRDVAFFGAGVSMGLFGIITQVTVKLVPKYWIVGTEQTVAFKDSLVTSGSQLIAAAKKEDYFHTVMFPNQNCNTVLQWIGKQSTDFDQSKYKAYEHVLDKRSKQLLAAAALLLANKFDSEGQYWVVGFILNLMNPAGPAQEFNDYWWRCLPNDDLTSIDTIIRVQFTELWIDAKVRDLSFIFRKKKKDCQYVFIFISESLP